MDYCSQQLVADIGAGRLAALDSVAGDFPLIDTGRVVAWVVYRTVVDTEEFEFLEDSVAQQLPVESEAGSGWSSVG